MEKEALFCEAIAMAQTAHNSGGRVFVQVERLSDKPARPHSVKVAGVCVDGVAAENKDEHYNITGRAVFSLDSHGLALKEVAPGVDTENDMLAHMDFVPDTSRVRLMDARIFREERMGLI